MIPQSRLMADTSDYQSTDDMRAYRRAGRRVIMLKAADAADDAGAMDYPARANQAHRNGLVVVHYVIVRYDVTPELTIDHYVNRIRPYWHRCDKMLIDLEEYSGQPRFASSWLQIAQKHLQNAHEAPRAWGYTDEAYMASAGRQLADEAPYWIIAAYDSLLLGAGTPKLPRGTHSILAGKQYTDGQYGAYPHSAPGIGPCDDTILTSAGERALLGGPAPTLKRPLRAKIPSPGPKARTCC